MLLCQVTAYGGELRYTVKYEPRQRSLVIDGKPDVVLQGNGISLEHFSQTKALPRVPATIMVSFREVCVCVFLWCVCVCVCVPFTTGYYSTLLMF